jgi:hypothetical protein
MSLFDPWQTISNMAHEARENGGYATLPTPDGHRLLKLWRMGPVTRFLIGSEEVAGPEFADEVQAQYHAWQHQQEMKHGFPGVTGFVDDWDLPATELTKRELAEIHILAGAAAKISDAYELVSFTKLAVGLLMEEWAERDGNA